MSSPECSPKTISSKAGAMDCELLRQRGILGQSEKIEQLIDETVEAVIALDTEMSGLLDLAYKKRLEEHITEGVFALGTPFLANMRRVGMPTAACTVLQYKSNQDASIAKSRNALGKSIGTGYDISVEPDPVHALQSLNNHLNFVNDELLVQNKRPVASMATIRADHPKVLEFVQAKNNQDFSKWRLNISVLATTELFALADSGEDWVLKDNAGESCGSMSAEELVNAMAQSAWYCGEPGVLLLDRIENDNPTPQWKYASTAPCAEVAMAEGDACQFGYINLGALTVHDNKGLIGFDENKFLAAVADMTRLLDAAVEKTVQTQGDLELGLVSQKRRIGVGVAGFADLLVSLNIPYDSDDATLMAKQISEMLDFSSKVESVRLSEERGSFPAFRQSRYMDKEWVRRKLKNNDESVIGAAKWNELFEEIRLKGIRHSSTTALPPTGTSSAILGISRSLEPHFSLNTRGKILPSIETAISRYATAEEAEELISQILLTGSVCSADKLESYPWLRTATQIEFTGHLAVQSAFQSYLDESLSKTVNMPNSSTIEDVATVFRHAAKYGLKGVTVFRDGCLQERTAQIEK